VPQVTYELSKEAIDVIIPCTEKDLRTLSLCIQGIRNNGEHIRRIIVVSKKPYTDAAEWFDERLFPFTKLDLALEIFSDGERAKKFVQDPYSKIGWIYQQFLKLYAPLVIPNISSNVLILDADTIFLNKVSFLGSKGEGLFNPSHYPVHTSYYVHAKKLFPWFRQVFEHVSEISHHMLFQKPVLKDFFKTIERTHKEVPWKVLCRCIDKQGANGSCMSEYTLYFNFAFLRCNQMRLRPLKWRDLDSLELLSKCKEEGYHFVSCHEYMRKKRSKLRSHQDIW
jgi:hypothetical protein